MYTSGATYDNYVFVRGRDWRLAPDSVQGLCGGTLTISPYRVVASNSYYSLKKLNNGFKL